jgi:CBS domain-containing protein
MKVENVMNGKVKFCSPDTNLAAVAATMWENDCGILPVVDGDARAIGVLTDRDIAIALGTKNRQASEIRADEVMSGKLYGVTPTDDIHTALKLMRKEKVRRLPVIDDQGQLKGILSLNDVALHAAHPNGTKMPALNYEDVVNTLKAICEHRHEVSKERHFVAGA